MVLAILIISLIVSIISIIVSIIRIIVGKISIIRSKVSIIMHGAATPKKARNPGHANHVLKKTL